MSLENHYCWQGKNSAIQHKYRVHVYANTAAAQGTTFVSNTMLFSTASSVDHYSNSDMHALIKDKNAGKSADLPI